MTEITIPEASELIGCSRQSVYNYMRDRELPYYTNGNGKVRVEAGDLAEWIERNKIWLKKKES